MNRGIYATATGMLAGQQAMDVIANNLANAATTGYKREAVAFDEAMLREMALGERTLGQLASGPAIKQTQTIHEIGAFQRTNNPLNLAIQSPNGMFAVQDSTGVRYTRDGSFTLDSQRRLTTSNGLPVLDEQLRPIILPPGIPSVGADGTVAVGDQTVGKIGVFGSASGRPENEGFAKVGGNLYVASNPTRIDAPIQSGALEASNVDVVGSMVQMISLGRSFEMAQRSMTTQDELTGRLIQSLSDR